MNHVHVGVLCASLVFAVPEAHANASDEDQSTGQTPEASGAVVGADVNAQDKSLALETVVVTAQKRSEDMQSVPITLTALTSDRMESAVVDDARSLETLVPGLQMDYKSAGVAPFLRGVGISTGTPGLDPPVATYLDDVYSPSTLVTTFSVGPGTERVEVLKGPQGTLFGRNATGGVLNVHTKNPGSDGELKVRAGFANYQTTTADLYASGPLTDSVSANLAVAYKNQAEGWGKNYLAGTDIRRGRELSARAKLNWSVGENTELLFAAWYANTWRDYGTYGMFPGMTAPGPSGTPYTNTHSIYDTDNQLQYTDSTFGGGSIRFEHDFGWANLVNIAAYQKVDVLYQVDGSAGPVPTFLGRPEWTDKLFTNELQLVSPSTSKVKWAAGVFALKEDLPFKLPLEGPGVPRGFLINAADLETTSYAVFAETTIPLTTAANLTLGGRYTRDTRDLKYGLSFSSPTPLNRSADQTYSEPTYRAALDYHFSDTVMGYASYNRGFKSGTYSVTSLSTPRRALEPETIDAYEVGVKSELLGRRLQVNAAAFWYDYKDMVLRAQYPNAVTVDLLNAGASRVKGVDLDMQMVVSTALRLYASAEYLDGEYTELDNGISSEPNPSGGSILTVVPSLAGNTMIQAPEFSGSLGFVYDVSLGDSDVSVGGSYDYRSRVYFDPDNRLNQGGRGLVNLNVSWEKGPWDLTIWGKNLTDEEYVSDGTAQSVGDVAIPGAPRTYGVSLSWSL